MGFFGFIILIVIAAGIWQWLKEQSSGRARTSSNRIVVHCPYCHERLEIEEPGNWNCAYCHNNFVYDQYGKAFRIEDFLSPPIEALVRLFAKIAKADGVVTGNEINLVDNIIKEEFTPSEELLSKIRSIFNEAKATPEGYQRLIHELYNYLSDDREVLYGVVGYLRDIAMLDNGITPAQEEVIGYAGNVFHLNDSHQKSESSYSNQRSGSTGNSSMDKYYAVLESQPSDSIETIKSNYRRLIKEYHPDRYINQNLPKDFIELANKKVKDVKEAYEKVMKEKSNA